MFNAVVQNNYRLSAALEASNQVLYMQKTQFSRTLEQDLSSDTIIAEKEMDI